MNEVERQAAAAVPVRALAWPAERGELVAFAAATLAVWAHTADEIRIGELVAVPFGVANAAVIGVWPSLRPLWRGVSAIAFGLFWAVTVIPYHVLPLLEGAVTPQNVSGLSRVVGGGAMFALGVAVLLRRDRA